MLRAMIERRRGGSKWLACALGALAFVGCGSAEPPLAGPPCPAEPTAASASATVVSSPASAAPSARVCTVEKAPAIPLAPPTVGEISVDQLARTLPKRRIVVGFDVDDTLVFSAPAFNALQPKFDPDVIRPKDYAKLTPAQQGDYHAFWNELNERADDASLPKKIGQRLLDLHVARKDDIYVVSRRQATEPPSDASQRRLERMFHVTLEHPLVQTNLTDKTPFLCRAGIELYYGDADSDVTAAVAAGATPVRVKRAANSYAKDAVHNGQMDEIVLSDSEE